MLNVVDDVKWECLAAVPDVSISRRLVVRELTELIAQWGKPGMIVSDNGACVHLQCRAGMYGQICGVALHRARKAGAEWLCRDAGFRPIRYQRSHAGRAAQRDSVQEDGSCLRRNRRLDG